MKASAKQNDLEWAPIRHRLRLDIQKSRQELEELEEDAKLGRILRKFIDEGHGYLEIDGGNPNLRNGDVVTIYSENENAFVSAIGTTLLEALESLGSSPEAPSELVKALAGEVTNA